MSVDVFLSGHMATSRTGTSSIQSAGNNLADVVREIDGRFPGFLRDIYSSSKNAIRDHVAVSINGNVVARNEMEPPVSDGDRIIIAFHRQGG